MKNQLTLTAEDKKRLIAGTLPVPLGTNPLEQLNDDEFRLALQRFREIPSARINMKTLGSWSLSFLNEVERRYMPPRSGITLGCAT